MNWKTLRNNLKNFIAKYSEWPNRGCGQPYELKAARKIKEYLNTEFTGKTDITTNHEPFAIDFSSGAWNVALHAVFFLISIIGGLLLGGLMKITIPFSWKLVDMGIFSIPLFIVIITAFFCLIIFLSRITAVIKGWNIFSFFIPNAESGNVITKINRNKSKCIIFVCHIDSARCLSKGKIPRWIYQGFLKNLIKNGLNLIPTIGSLFTVLFLLITITLTIFGLSAPWLHIVLIIIAIIAIIMLLPVVLEAYVAVQSANQPYSPGFNDNFSGVSIMIGLTMAMKQMNISSFASDRDIILLFSGAEEIGVFGTRNFVKQHMEELVKKYNGLENIEIYNFDSVSGKTVHLYYSEKDLAGIKRSGKLSFSQSIYSQLINHTFSKSELLNVFTQDEINIFFNYDADANTYKPNLNFETEPLQSGTDLTSFCIGKKYNNKAHATGFVSYEKNPQSPGFIPRDYHELTDTYEKLMDSANYPENFGSIIYIIFMIYTILK